MGALRWVLTPESELEQGAVEEPSARADAKARFTDRQWRKRKHGSANIRDLDSRETSKYRVIWSIFIHEERQNKG